MKCIYYVLGLSIFLLSACRKNPVNSNPYNEPAEIYSFVFERDQNSGLAADVSGTISNDSIFVSLPYGANITSLIPTIGFIGASIIPGSQGTQNFSSPVLYTVIAQDGSRKDFIVIATILYRSKAFIGTNFGTLYAVDGNTGAFLWSYTPTIIGPAVCEPAYYNDAVYFCTTSEIISLDATTGLARWKTPLNGPFPFSYIIVSNGIIYHSTGSRLKARNADTGAELWTIANSSTFGYPSCVDGLLYCPTVNGVRAFDATTGQLVQTYGNTFCLGNVLVTSDAIYTSSEGKTILSFNKTTAALNWQFDEGFSSSLLGSNCSPTIHDGIVFNGAFSHYMYAVNAATGQQKWKAGFVDFGIGLDANFTAPVVANGMLYTTKELRTVAFDEQSGIVKWSFNSSGPCTVFGNTVFVSSFEGLLTAVDAFTGTLKWSFSLSSGERIIESGACVVTEDGRVFNSGVCGTYQ